jgi:peptide/nickel transport system substrate-binding protein
MSRSTLALAALLIAGVVAVAPAGGTSEQTPRRGGTIVLLRPGEPPCLNPFSCPVGFNDPILSQVLEGAYELGPDLVSRPNLVSGVALARNPFSITYRIRPNARWSDGVPVTAQDFLFTHEVILRQPMRVDPGRELPITDLHRKVRRARALGAKTYRVELSEAVASWRDLYPFVLPRHVLAGQDLTKVWANSVDDPRTGAPIGSGPFLVSRWERGTQLALVRNPRYWGPHTAYLDRFVYRFVRQDPLDPLAPIRANVFDVALTLGGAMVSAELARQVRALPGWRIAAFASPGHEHLSFRVGSGGHPALRSPLVRRALAFGIDRVAIGRVLMAEAPSSSRRPPDSATFLPGETFYRPAWSGYRYDVPRARRLLAEAGCRPGPDSIFVCGTERLRLRFRTTGGVPDRERALELVKTHLRAVGVEVDIEYVPFGPFFTQLVESGAFDAILFAWVKAGGLVPPEAICGDEFNWGGYCSRLVTRDAAQASRILDPALRARVLNAADAKLARAVPLLPLRQVVNRVVIRRSVRGIHLGGSPFEFTQNSEDWWLADSR